MASKLFGALKIQRYLSSNSRLMVREALSNFLKKSQSSFHRYLVRRYINEQSVSLNEAKLGLSLHFITCICLFATFSPVFLQFKAVVLYVSQPVLVVGSIYTVMLTAMFAVQVSMPRSQLSAVVFIHMI